MSSSSSKSIRAGVSLLSRMLLNPVSTIKPNPILKVTETTPSLFPSLSKLQNWLIRSEDDEFEKMRKMFDRTFLSPFGLRELSFFLPEGDGLLNEPILLQTKRTYQSSTLQRKKNAWILGTQCDPWWQESDQTKE